jgi:hypothetical protein
MNNAMLYMYELPKLCTSSGRKSKPNVERSVRDIGKGRQGKAVLGTLNMQVEGGGEECESLQMASVHNRDVGT